MYFKNKLIQITLIIFAVALGACSKSNDEQPAPASQPATAVQESEAYRMYKSLRNTSGAVFLTEEEVRDKANVLENSDVSVQEMDTVIHYFIRQKSNSPTDPLYEANAAVERAESLLYNGIKLDTHKEMFAYFKHLYDRVKSDDDYPQYEFALSLVEAKIATDMIIDTAIGKIALDAEMDTMETSVDKNYSEIRNDYIADSFAKIQRDMKNLRAIRNPIVEDGYLFTTNSAVWFALKHNIVDGNPDTEVGDELNFDGDIMVPALKLLEDTNSAYRTLLVQKLNQFSFLARIASQDLLRMKEIFVRADEANMVAYNAWFVAMEKETNMADVSRDVSRDVLRHAQKELAVLNAVYTKTQEVLLVATIKKSEAIAKFNSLTTEITSIQESLDNI